MSLDGAQVRCGLPIAVWLSSLPDLEDRADAVTGATFARRFRTTAPAPIGADDLAEALQEFVHPDWEVTGRSETLERIRTEPDAVTSSASARSRTR